MHLIDGHNQQPIVAWVLDLKQRRKGAEAERHHLALSFNVHHHAIQRLAVGVT